MLLCLFMANILLGVTYPFKSLTVDDGLPQSTISAILKDFEGFLWLGTLGGLARYDGTNIRPYTSYEGYPFFLVRGIIEKEPGVLWIAEATEGLWELKGDSATRIIFDERYPDANINFLCQGNDGRVLVGAEPGGLYIFEDTTIVNIGPADGLVSDEVISGAIDTEGNIWVGTYRNGVQRIRNGKPEVPLTMDDGLPADYIRYILPRANGEVWIGTKKGIYILDGKKDTTLLNSPGEERFVFHILEEDKDNVWVSTANNGGGLIHIKNRKIVEILDYDSGLPSFRATCTFIDEYGTIFIGTANGLSKITQRQFVNFSKGDGLVDPYITGVCQTSDGTIWVGTQSKGIHQLKGNLFTPLSTPGLDKYLGIKHIQVVYDQVWGATSRGLIILDRGVPIRNKISDMLEDKTLRRITVTKDKDVYITAYQNLYRIIGDSVIEITYNLKDRKYSFWALEKDKNGLLWLATNGQGLWYLKNGTWIRKVPPLPSFPEKFFGISRDGDGNIYFASSRGAYKWDGEKIIPVFTKRHTVWDILPTKENGIWFGTSHGLFQKWKNRINIYNMRSGLISSEFNISSFYEDREGNLWFGGIGGLVKYRKQKSFPSQTCPETYILSIKSNSKTITDLNDLVFDYQHNDVTINFIGIDLGNPESVRYRYKLVNIDKDWSLPIKETYVTYPHLPPGNYTFFLQAKGPLGIWNEIPATISFRILKPWWATWWAKLILFTTIAFFIWGVIKWRMRLLDQRNLLLEKKVRERTMELLKTNKRLSQEILEREQAEKAANERLEELEQWYKLTVGRELKMAELKTENEQLRKQLAELKKKINFGTNTE